MRVERFSDMTNQCDTNQGLHILNRLQKYGSGAFFLSCSFVGYEPFYRRAT